MERNSRKLLKLLEQDGWMLVRINGDHHMFKHATKRGMVVVPNRRRILA